MKLLYPTFHLFVIYLLFVVFVLAGHARAGSGGDDLTKILFTRSGPYRLLSTGGTFRTQSNASNCAAINVTSTGAPITWPLGAKIDRAYLFWAASGSSIDNQVTLNGKPVTADSKSCHLVNTIYNVHFNGCVADVTNYVDASISNFKLQDLSIATTYPYDKSCTVLGGWSLVIVYHSPMSARELNFIRLYEGFKWAQHASLGQKKLSGFIAANPTRLKVISIAWEGDPNFNAGEEISINNNLVGTNLFDSKSTSFAQDNTYGVDVDAIDAKSQIQPGDTTLTWEATTGRDLVLLQAVGIYDLSVTGISGFVYEDPDGDGVVNTDKRPVKGAKVKLYDPSGNLLQETNTDADGYYAFPNLTSGDYYVVVDSKTIGPADFNAGYEQGDVWAEQTWVNAPAGAKAYCDSDANPSTSPSELTGSSVCFGGAYGDRSDDASQLSTAEHRVKVHVNTSTVSEVNFGFSFNVVTNTNDQDDDTSANRTAQGSLRQFIQNANAIAGPNTMRFVPVVPTNASGGGGNWWSVALTTGSGSDGDYLYGLPLITDDATTIDGKAYCYADSPTDCADWDAATGKRNPNPGSVSAPGPVGTGGHLLGGFEKPELEVDVNDWGIGFAVGAGVNNTKIKRLAMYNSGVTNSGGPESKASLVWVRGDTSQSSTGNEVRDSFLGPRADGSDPGFSTTPASNREARAGVTTDVYAQISVIHNYIAFVSNTGVELQGRGVVRENFVEEAGADAECGDGVSVEQWDNQHVRSRGDVVVKQNFIRRVAAYGIESWGAPGAYTFVENTVTETGRGNSLGSYCGDTTGVDINESERGGIRVFGSGSLVEKNVVHHVPGHGVVVVAVDSSTPSRQNTISRNSFYQNGGIAIDLDQSHIEGAEGNVNPNGDGVTPNDEQTNSSQQNNGLDYPIFTLAELDGAGLHLVGYVGTSGQHLTGPFTIEVYKADDDGNNNGEVEAGDRKSVPHGEGRWYLGSCTSAANGTFDCTLTVPSGVSLAAGDAVTGITIDADGNTSEFGANRVVSVRVSGRVYEDLQPNGVRDAAEDWTNGTTVYVKLIYQGSVVGVTQVDTGDGAYHFDVVAAGNYTLIADINGDTTDATPNPPSGWLFVSPPDGRRSITVGTRPIADQDFGLFHGARVLGTVFRDTGDGPGTANDALQNGNEPGVAGVAVSVSDGNHTRTTQTDASGHYLLYVPVDWGDVVLSHAVRPASGYNVGGGGVHRAADWPDANGAGSSAARIILGSAANISGQSLPGRNFGVVFPSVFRPDQNGFSTSPGTVSYAHTYKPGTQGTVVFSRAGGDYTYQLRLDANCDGDFDDGGESWRTISTTARPSFTVGDAWPRNPDGSFRACPVEVRVMVPDGEPEGAVDIAEVAADLSWANNGAVIDRRLIVDTTRVRILGTLRLKKLGRRVADPTMDRAPKNFPADYAASVDGAPGDVLEYCIAYTNIGSDAVTDVKISDPVPFFADALADAYGAGKAIYWRDATGAVHWLTASSDGDAGTIASGILEVRAEARLDPGEGGLVCYRVQIR